MFIFYDLLEGQPVLVPAGVRRGTAVSRGMLISIILFSSLCLVTADHFLATDYMMVL